MNPIGISINIRNVEWIPAYAKAGFEVMEISLPRQPLDALKEFGDHALALAKENGLRLWSVHLPFGGNLDISSLDEIERLKVIFYQSQVIEMAREWGAQTLVIHGSAEPYEDHERSARIEASSKSLAQLQKAAGSMMLALENLPRTCIARVSGEAVPMSMNCAGLCFDVNHLLMQSHEDFLKEAAGRVVTTHLSDYDGIDERHWIPGAGVVPWKLVYDRLTEAGYAGPWLFELGSPKEGQEYDPAAVLAAWKKAAGV